MVTTLVGVAGYGLYLPSEFETAEQIADRSGLTPDQVTGDLGLARKVRPGPDDQPGVMALEAARAALAVAPDVDPATINAVIWTGEEYKDHLCQTAGIRLQEEIGARQAWAFDLVGQGTTLLTGLRLARDLMLGDPDVETVLLAGGSRTVDLVNYANPDTRWLLPTAAGGGALILRRGLARNRLLGWSMVVDPEMADEVYVPGGGTLNYFSPENLGTSAMFFQTSRPEVVQAYLAERFAGRLAEAIEDALADAGLAGADYLALPHLTPVQRRTVLDRLGLNDEQGLDLADTGHVGPYDALFSLDRALAAGRVNPGDKVVLAAAGIGFTHVAAVLEWTG